MRTTLIALTALAAASAASSPAPALAQPGALSAAEKANEALVRRQFEEVISQGRLDLLDETVTEDFIQHNEGSGAADDTKGAGSGRETLRGYLTTLKEDIPDFRLDIQKIVTQGDTVSVYAIAHGTHTGPLFGLPATRDEARLLWGVYSTVPLRPGVNLDLAYLGIRRERSAYAFTDAAIDEDRHTVDARLWGGIGAVAFDVEAGYQFGAFETAQTPA